VSGRSQSQADRFGDNVLCTVNCSRSSFPADAPYSRPLDAVRLKPFELPVSALCTSCLAIPMLLIFAVSVLTFISKQPLHCSL